jgi:hypothetical protein
VVVPGECQGYRIANQARVRFRTSDRHAYRMMSAVQVGRIDHRKTACGDGPYSTAAIDGHRSGRKTEHGRSPHKPVALVEDAQVEREAGMIEGLVELRARHSGDARGHPQPGLAARSLDDAAQPRGPGIETRVELADLAIADAQQAPSPGNEKSSQRRADHGDLVDAERAKIIPADVAPFDDPQSGPVGADGNVARRIGHHALPHAGSRSALIPFEKVPTALVVPPCRSVIPSDPKPGQAVLGTSGNEGGQIGQAPASASRFPLSRDVIIENPDGAVAATAYRRRIAYWQGRMGHPPGFIR